MFVKKEISTITVDVTIVDPETGEPNSCQARWKLHPVDASETKIAEINAGNISDEQLVEADLIELLGITDEKGKSVSDDAELREWFLKWPHTRGPLIRSWFNAQSGRAAAAQKN
ncbi:hypothetical protein F0A16_20660 [Salinicola corii]|uniref:Uncharacterized protein n=1 Tax=Salinicola corii TaxID=2606937 RepID=A0A640W7D6_9GAMM|nr:hypothetical protein [Salinicola corii]KAA0015501.1 hypothetical protein F0A16_20660 [Salinicola corii]